MPSVAKSYAKLPHYFNKAKLESKKLKFFLLASTFFNLWSPRYPHDKT